MAQKIKKIPQRKCVGCGNGFPKKELIRVVRDSEGRVSVDLTGKAAGRGAYLCKSAECFRKARKTGRLNTNLGVNVPEEVLDRLEREISAGLSKDADKHVCLIMKRRRNRSRVRR